MSVASREEIIGGGLKYPTDRIIDGAKLQRRKKLQAQVGVSALEKNVNIFCWRGKKNKARKSLKKTHISQGARSRRSAAFVKRAADESEQRVKGELVTEQNGKGWRNTCEEQEAAKVLEKVLKMSWQLYQGRHHFLQCISRGSPLAEKKLFNMSPSSHRRAYLISFEMLLFEV